ncbi:WD40/YVTN/BNR-like repeat-containing protein [Haloarchaeobius sp. TZWSO28]|uniref:WD40/YVTN/BNR-like repeat-containing protein n=1 Tax=Haloarchaeobius sp. TZWSO28 TaxID=3446119 RepID=UPI003EBAF687
MSNLTRREALTALGATGVWLGTGGVVSAEAGGTDEFSSRDSPTQKTVRSVTQSREGPYAVGENGDVLARRATEEAGSRYERVLDAGLTAGDKSFYGVDATVDGRNVWIAGESGRVGYYDAVDEQFTDFSKPNGLAATWRDVAVGEAAGDERVYLFGGGGQVLVGERDDAGMSWGTATTFNGGNAIYGAARLEENEVWCCDSTGTVYETRDGGQTWTDIGVDAATVPLYDIAVAAEDAITVVGGSGRIYEYDGTAWQGFKPGGSAIRGVDRTSDEQSGHVAAGAGGTLYTRTTDGWTTTNLATSKTLRGVALDTTGEYPDAVVGNAGKIYERGGYTAYPDTLRLEVDDGASLSYGFDVSGPTAGTSLNEADDTVTSVADGYEVDGTLGDGDGADAYRFGGDVTGLTVTDGSASDLTTVRSGTEVSVERLADRSWSRVSTPVDVTLYEVVESSAGLYAVGGSGRIIRTDSTGEWDVVTKTGVRGGGNSLFGAGVTDDGESLWVAGGSGALGHIDATTGEITDYSQPGGATSSWTDVAVTGSAGSESIYLVNGSGEVLRGENDRGAVTFDEPVKPGNGSTLRGVTFIDDDTGYTCDGNAKVYETRDGGKTWTDIGIESAGVTLYDVAAESPDDITVVGGSGRLFRYNGAVWTLTKLGGNSRLSVDRDADRGVAVGGSAELFEREIEGWTGTAADPSDVTLYSSIVVQDDPTTGKYAVGGNGVALRQTFDDPLF